MIDPVTGFVYPDPWVQACTSPEALDLAASGLGVLTANGTVLRRGFTTGTTAAAAAKAAVLSLRSPCTGVSLTLPCGLAVRVLAEGSDGCGTCRKDPGDYRDDVTGGILIRARAVIGPETVVIAGDGIGRYTRDTPRFRAGDAAISEVARRSIERAVKEACREIGVEGAHVTLDLPDGRVVAERTLNSRVGIMGGISLLGTTGLVEPWDDHLAESVTERIGHAHRVVLTTGRIGLAHARRRYPDWEVVLVGGRIGEGLAAVRGEAVLFGLPALILKHLWPGILERFRYPTVEELMVRPEAKEAIDRAFRETTARYPGLQVVLIDRTGRIIAEGP
ncbi:MAG TPA: cobalt-precorrin-5B (C(1))-methyltransferase [Methanoregulaceae archaeon]|nr:cobalt-precorrin-5B (C(1))-methyltransferase [Methanoregulaceae archaeon]